MNVEPPETLVIIESIVYKSNGFPIYLFLAQYCSEMNPIELEWQHIKKDELAGQMFEDELELAYAVINGVEARRKKGNYPTKRIKFSSELVT